MVYPEKHFDVVLHNLQYSQLLYGNSSYSSRTCPKSIFIIIIIIIITEITMIMVELSKYKSLPVNYDYHKMLLNENGSYLVLVAKQILLVTINNVYWYKTRNNISLSIHCGRTDYRINNTIFRLKHIWIVTSTFCFAIMTVVWDQWLIFHLVTDLVYT